MRSPEEMRQGWAAVGETGEVDLRDWRRQLRVATAAGDADQLLGLLRDPPPVECLQAVGAALCAVRGVDVPAVVDLIERSVVDLRERGWVGDAELAHELEARLGRGPAEELNATPVDLDQLGEVLDGPAGSGGLLDLETGAVWSAALIENALDAGIEGVPEEADGVRWIEVCSEGHASRDLRAFIATVDQSDLVERLDRTVRGKGAFRRFRNELERWPHEASRWHAFNDDRRVGRARAWLAEAGYRHESRPATPA